ncbi:MAG: hypothetical protein ACRDT4_25010 [Micromonosporaceae bacterium]
MNELRTLLRQTAGDLEPPPIPADLWGQGRRMRRRQRLAGVAVVQVVVLLAVGLPWLMLREEKPPPPADSVPAVPEKLYVPYEWQASVGQSPPGDATVMFSGDGDLRGTDLFDHEGKAAVVGRGGDYRMLLYGGSETMAGQDVLLSPNGRYVAQSDFTDGLGFELVDLRTGKTRGYPGSTGAVSGRPTAWSPDGRSLLVQEWPPNDVEVTNLPRLALVELTTGRSRVLHRYGKGVTWTTRFTAAFSPDSRHVVITDGTKLHQYAVDGTAGWTAELGSRTHLVGVGAYTDDGGQIAVTTMQGCLQPCTERELAERRWSFSYLDPATGKPTDGPELTPITAMAVRGLGWHGDQLVAVTHRPEGGMPEGVDVNGWDDFDYWAVGDAHLVAIGPTGTKRLIDSPEEMLGIDVPRDLIVSGRFGGGSPEPSGLPPRWEVVLFYVAPYLCLGLLVGVLALVAVLLWRRRQSRLRAVV